MRTVAALFALLVVIKDACCGISSNFSCSKSQNQKECLAQSIEAALTSLHNCNAMTLTNLFEPFLVTSFESAAPLEVDRIVSLKLKEHSCIKATEFIRDNNCKQLAIKPTQKGHGNSTESDSYVLSTNAIYLYAWLSYRLIFISLQQM